MDEKLEFEKMAGMDQDRHYTFIHDEKELLRFFDILPDLKDFEVFFCSLSCRKKYLTEEEREILHITRAEMFDRKLIREKNWNRFLRTIRKYETIEGSYLSKNGLPVPQHSLTVYFNINPSNSLKSLKEFNQKISDWQFEMFVNGSSSFKGKFNKLDIEIMNCFQRNRGTKNWIDIDFDVPKTFDAPKEMKEFLKGKNLRYFWIDTKSGYHLLVDRRGLRFNPEEICIEGRRLSGEDAKEIVVNKNEMIPLPGTLQGGYPVRVLWGESK